MLSKSEKLKIWRHKNGISKRYYDRYTGEIPFGTNERNRLYRKQSNAKSRYPGTITIGVIQRIYEDNIKKYGTLTCYLCLEPIKFGDDTLEHKVSRTRGGTNNYNNLAISCFMCNCKKHKKTEEEYRKECAK